MLDVKEDISSESVCISQVCDFLTEYFGNPNHRLVYNEIWNETTGC